MSDTGGRLGRRLKRILLLLPYAIQHPGVSVDELARKFGVAKKDLVDDLNLVFMCGLPGYGPGDLIDVDMDDDRVYVRMADYFAAPLRLTPAEALALYAGGRPLVELPGMEGADALRRALEKLGRALGIDSARDGSPGSSGIEIAVEGGAGEHLASLQQALAHNKQLKLEYFSASSGKLTERSVEPWGLVAALGRWYLVALDHLSAEERMFRTDRIKSVTMLDEPAETPADFDPQRYRGAWVGGGGGSEVSLEISPEVALWFEEYYPVLAAEQAGDGWRRVTLSSGGERWAGTLVLRLGAGVRAVEPRAVLDEARRLAAILRSRHA